MNSNKHSQTKPTADNKSPTAAGGRRPALSTSATTSASLSTRLNAGLSNGSAIIFPSKYSRRAFIKAALASLTIAGCASQTPQATGESLISKIPTVLRVEPSATPAPMLTPTPLPSADGVAQRYLSAWQAGDFETMFNLLSPQSQRQITAGEFYTLYQHAWNQTTANNIQTQIQSLLADGSQATAVFHSQWFTSLFDVIEADHTMLLRFENGQWTIDWQPTLVLPQLGYNVTLALLEETPARGNIFDATGRHLASNEQIITVGVVPAQIEDEGLVLNELSALTGLGPNAIKEKMSKARANWFVPLADIDFDTNVEYHERLSALAGVERRPHPVRAYPENDSAAHIIGALGGIPAETVDSYRGQGYRGDELIGLTGVEGWGEPFLAGKRGGQLVTFSPTGGILAEIASAPARPGGQVYLSLDIDLQKRAEEILGAQRGAIVVMEPTGFVKAMATWPRFDPNDFAAGVTTETWAGLLNDDQRPLVNRAAQGTYPPASVFKIVTIAAALEKLGYSPQQSFFCSGTWYGLGEEFPKKCWLESGHGQISLKDGLTQSCDTVFYEVGLALHKQNPNLLPEMARAFGFDDITGIMGIEEAAGVVPDNNWKTATLGEAFFDGDAVNMAIGQGYMLTTPLQIAQMLATVANNGRLYRPQLVRQISSRDSGDQFFAPDEVAQLPISAENLAIIQEALLGVAHGSRGTAREAFKDVAFTVIGKTGTAETTIAEPHAWFAGYAPADDPAIVIVVMLENAGEGSEKAAPLFRLMAESYFEWVKRKT